MIIYVMRHGETVWNAKKITQGISQNRLSKNGKKQAEMTANKVKDIKFDYIVCSPLMRTVQTANIMKKHNNAKIIKNDKIIECDQGVFTGRSKLSFSKEEIELKNSRSKNCGMESIEKIVSRVRLFLDEIKKDYADKIVLVVTHNVIASAIESIAKFGDFDDNVFRNKVNFDNAQIKEIEI